MPTTIYTPAQRTNAVLAIYSAWFASKAWRVNGMFTMLPNKHVIRGNVRRVLRPATAYGALCGGNASNNIFAGDLQIAIGTRPTVATIVKTRAIVWHALLGAS